MSRVVHLTKHLSPAWFPSCGQSNLLIVGWQLVREASGGRVDIIHGDALEVDMETVCQEYVKKRDWEDGI